MTFGGGKAFGQVFVDKSGGETRTCGEKNRGDGGGPGRNDGAEGRSMEVLENFGLGGKCVDVVRNQGGQRDVCHGGFLGALELHVVESVGGVASALQGGGPDE